MVQRKQKEKKLGRYDTIGGSRRKQHKDQSLKNQIRSLERLIRNNKLKGDALANKRKVLNNLKIDLSNQKEETRSNNKNRRLAVRYHQVRFLERVKLVRKLKHAKKAKNDDLFQKLGNDLRYVLFFPKGEIFISIIKKDADLKEGALEQRNKLYEKALNNASAAQFDLELFLQRQSKSHKQKQVSEMYGKPVESSPNDDDDFFL